MRRLPINVASLAPVKMTGQVVRRYRGLLTQTALACSTPYSPTQRLEWQDIFTALVTPANVKPGWLVYNQAHQDGLNPPFPWRDRGKFPLRTVIRREKAKYTCPSIRSSSFLSFYDHIFSLFFTYDIVAQNLPRLGKTRLHTCVLHRKKRHLVVHFLKNKKISGYSSPF